MTIDTAKIRAAAEAVKGWRNCNQAWLDTSEDAPAAVVGHIGEDGEPYPVVTVDCDQYFAGGDSLPLAKFYATANPATVSEMCDEIERLRKDAERYRWLRDRHTSDSGIYAVVDPGPGNWNPIEYAVGTPFGDLDAAIDRAMMESK